MDIIYYILLTLFLILSVFLVLLVLIQKGRGGGLSAAFGGGGGGNTAFGAKTGDVLTWATASVFAAFVILCITLNLLANGIHDRDRNPLHGAATSQPSATTPDSGALPLDPNFIPKKEEATQPSTQPAAAPSAAAPSAEATPPASTQPSAATPPTTQP